MRGLEDTLPLNLRNGTSKPNNYNDIILALTKPLSYKITVMSSDSYAHHWRIVHHYFIGVTGDDPSNVRKFMEKMGLEQQNTWEEGRLLVGVTGFVFLVPYHLLPKANNLIMLNINKAADSYVIVNYHNIVQYTPAINRDYIVFTSLPFDL